MNANLVEQNILVHADIHELDSIFVEEKDEANNEPVIKGVGEIEIVAMPAAIANAVCYATVKE